MLRRWQRRRARPVTMDVEAANIPVDQMTTLLGCRLSRPATRKCIIDLATRSSGTSGSEFSFGQSRHQQAPIALHASQRSNSNCWHTNKTTIKTMTTTASKKTSAHYERHTADSYESAYFYSPGEYTDWLKEKVRSALHVEAADLNIGDAEGSKMKRRLIDIGGGTGNFTRMILDGVPNMEAVIVDPFLEPGNITGSSNNDSDAPIKFVKAGAEDFATNTRQSGTSEESAGSETEWWKRNYHQVLMKEVVHHLAAADRVNIFRGMRTGLATSAIGSTSASSSSVPSILMVTRPQVDIDYPLWLAARKVWAANQPSESEIKADLVAAGFDEVLVESTTYAYPCSIQLDRWLDMVRNRFWSTFSNFSDEELEDACALIREEAKTDSNGVATFEDRLVFITAK